MVLLLLSALAHAGCDTPATPTQILSETNTAIDAFSSLDETGFTASVNRIDGMVECLGSVLSPGVAASVHRVHALRAFLAGDDAATTDSFVSARAIQGEVDLPESVAPAGGPVDGLWQGADPARASARTAITAPAGAKVWVDGSASTTRPEDVPSVVQVGRAANDMVWTSVAGPGWSGVPSSLSSEFVVAPPAPVASSTKKSRSGGGGGPWWGLAAGSGIAAASLFGTAIATNLAYKGSGAQGLLTVNQASYWGSVGIGTATLAFGGIALGTK